MKLFQDILKEILMEEEVQVVFQNLKMSPSELVEMRCYMALRKIKKILEDDTLDDKECFAKIEEIVHIFEVMGSDCGTRHEF
ncbi:MAG: hypothetical protein MR278_05495 [Bacteroidales bacterium]|nr:hypothetical protein [Anaerotignum sp.]MCI5679418.1 hypothetical protein [Bacteroidales bacterium]MDY3927519.1 hypothetical protein [Anaerotignum sp.]